MKKIYLFLVLIFLSACSDKDERPNILFIMSDDHAYQAISAYSDKLIQTPNIDRIADEGILFTNACVTNSICAPSRAVILTGKHSHLNGKIDNHAKFDTTQVTFPQLFQKAGYQTAMYGKLHFGNNPKGVDDFWILPGQGDYINPKFLGAKKDTLITGYVTDVITDLTLDWFKNKRDKNKPFMMMYLHKAPHRAWWPSPEKFAEFYEKEFPEPESDLMKTPSAYHSSRSIPKLSVEELVTVKFSLKPRTMLLPPLMMGTGLVWSETSMDNVLVSVRPSIPLTLRDTVNVPSVGHDMSVDGPVNSKVPSPSKSHSNALVSI